MPVHHLHKFLLIALALPAVLLRAQSTQPAQYLDQLSGSGLQQNLALHALTDADPKIIDPILINRLNKNVAGNTGNNSRTEHQALHPPLQGSVYIGLAPENQILAEILVQHRATQSVPAIQSALTAALKQNPDQLDATFTRSLACSIYQLSGKTPDCYNFEAKTSQPFAPTVYEEESMRDILQTHLTPFHGLTALLSIHGQGDQGQFIAANETLTLRLDLQNHTPSPIALDLAPASITLQYTQNNHRLSTPSATLPPPRFTLDGKEVPAPASLAPKQTLSISWQTPTKDQFKDWSTEYHHIRMSYTPATDATLKALWKTDALISNSIIRTLTRE